MFQPFHKQWPLFHKPMLNLRGESYCDWGLNSVMSNQGSGRLLHGLVEWSAKLTGLWLAAPDE